MVRKLGNVWVRAVFAFEVCTTPGVALGEFDNLADPVGGDVEIIGEISDGLATLVLPDDLRISLRLRFVHYTATSNRRLSNSASRQNVRLSSRTEQRDTLINNDEILLRELKPVVWFKCVDHAAT